MKSEMTSYVIRRLIQCVAVIVLVSIVTFLVIRLLPGNPLMIYAHSRNLTTLTVETQQELIANFGLDKPLVMQYLNWIGGIFHGNFGYSYFLNESVSHALKQRLPVTLYLGILSFIVSAILGPVFGTICAIRRGKWIDTWLTALANLGITAPTFWLGVLMIWVFALKLKLLPVLGYVSPLTDYWSSTKHLIMPVICLSLPAVAGLTRQTRSSILEVVRQDYVRTAWSKGLTERIVVFKHILKNGFIPIITVLGMFIGGILSGAVLVEVVFNINGLGQMMVNAVFSKDYVIVQAGTLIMAVAVVLSNLLVDISYGWFDPRIRFD
jgi:peptide/nickel transport system permease protein